jgi:hypothetical protein
VIWAELLLSYGFDISLARRLFSLESLLKKRWVTKKGAGYKAGSHTKFVVIQKILCLLSMTFDTVVAHATLKATLTGTCCEWLRNEKESEEDRRGRNRLSSQVKWAFWQWMQARFAFFFFGPVFVGESEVTSERLRFVVAAGMEGFFLGSIEEEEELSSLDIGEDTRVVLLEWTERRGTESMTVMRTYKRVHRE